MRFTYLMLLILVNLVLFFSCSSRSDDSYGLQDSTSVKDGVLKSKYPDGTLRAEITMKNGKKTGPARQYYPNGKLSLAIDYVDGMKNGFVRKYYESGTLYEEIPYENGVEHGIKKKYRENGKLSAEVPYNGGNPCMGLKEYLTDGSPRSKYPSIVVKPIDNILKNGKYTLIISMSDNSKRVEYYRGDLLEGNCLSNFMGNIFEGKEKGTGEITYKVPPGGFYMEEINIVAKVRTLLGNYYITQRKYHLAIENRY